MPSDADLARAWILATVKHELTEWTPEEPLLWGRVLDACARALLAAVAAKGAADVVLLNALWLRYGHDKEWGAAQQVAVSEAEAIILSHAATVPEVPHAE